MKLAAAVCWYHEPLGSLERCIRSLYDVVDYIVIADGRWAGFHADDAPVESPRDQTDLVEALLDGRPHLEMWPPIDGPWASQVEKRSYVYAAASAVADWTLVIDADEHVEHHDRHGLRAELARADRLTARVGSRTVYGPQAAPGVALQPRLFSAAEGPLRVEWSHNGVRNAAGDWLTGDPAYVPVVPSFDVGDHLRLFHEQGANRPRERELADRAYRTARRRQRIEGWPSRGSRA